MASLGCVTIAQIECHLFISFVSGRRRRTCFFYGHEKLERKRCRIISCLAVDSDIFLCPRKIRVFHKNYPLSMRHLFVLSPTTNYVLSIFLGGLIQKRLHLANVSAFLFLENFVSFRMRRIVHGLPFCIFHDKPSVQIIRFSEK